MTFSMPKKLAAVLALVIQVTVGSVLFALLYFVALALAWFLRHGGALFGAPDWLNSSANWVEWAIWGFDLVFYALFLLSELLSFGRSLIREWRGSDG